MTIFQRSSTPICSANLDWKNQSWKTPDETLRAHLQQVDIEKIKYTILNDIVFGKNNNYSFFLKEPYDIT